MTKRGRQAAAVHALKAQGLNGTAIALRLDLSLSYTYSLLADPSGAHERARKRSYGGTCESCGATTTGCNGARLAPSLCSRCATTARKIWTRATMVEAIRLWAATYGQPPTATDWRPAGLNDPVRRREAERRYRNRGWPPSSAVVQGFGSWNAAVAAAGFTPRRRYSNVGPNGLPVAVFRVTLALRQAGASLSQLAEWSGVTDGEVRRRLTRAYKLEANGWAS